MDARLPLADADEVTIVSNMTKMTDATQPNLKLRTADDTPSREQEPEAPVDQRATPESIVEAVLFAAEVPLAGAKIADLVGKTKAGEIKQHIAALNTRYEQQGASFRIEELAGGFQMLTLPMYNEWIAKLLRTRQETRLSQAALETLAVVAYKQPILRADVEALRGVAVGEVLNRLRELNLVKIVGRAEDIGRPLLYGTTKKFLDVFGLASLDDLPKDQELLPPEQPL